MKTIRKLLISLLILVVIFGSFVLGGYFGIKERSEETPPPEEEQPGDEQPDEEEPHVHVFSEEWSYGIKNHYHACECGTVKDMTPHTFVNGICTVCGAEEPEPPHVHTYADEWSYSEQYHFHESTCGHNIISNVTPHTFVNGICTVCGYAEQAEIKEYEIWYDTLGTGTGYLSIECNWSAVAGKLVKFTLTLDKSTWADGYAVEITSVALQELETGETYTYLDKNGEGEYTFIMPAFDVEILIYML